MGNIGEPVETETIEPVTIPDTVPEEWETVPQPQVPDKEPLVPA